MTLTARWYRAWARASNRVKDIAARLEGLCVQMPAGLPGSPGYHFWRCDLERGHDGWHRSGNYKWIELEPGMGYSEYLPIEGARGQDRIAVRTMRQDRLMDEWHANRRGEGR